MRVAEVRLFSFDDPLIIENVSSTLNDNNALTVVADGTTYLIPFFNLSYAKVWSQEEEKK